MILAWLGINLELEIKLDLRIFFAQADLNSSELFT